MSDYMDAAICAKCGEHYTILATKDGGHTCADLLPRTDEVSREDLLADEIAKQRNIYRPGTDEAVLRRAAISALVERGEY